MEVGCGKVFGKGCWGNCIKGIRLGKEVGAGRVSGLPCPEDLEDRSLGSLSLGSTVGGIDNVVRERDGEDGRPKKKVKSAPPKLESCR